MMLIDKLVHKHSRAMERFYRSINEEGETIDEEQCTLKLKISKR